MKSKKLHLPAILMVLLFAITIYAGVVNQYKDKSVVANVNTKLEEDVSQGKVSSAASSDSVIKVNDEKVLGIWVPYMSLDMGSTDKSEKAFQDKYNAILNKSKTYGMNTLIVQVRPFGDSYYKSKVFPWSHLLTGSQGKDPGYDPLTYMVKAAHDNGMRFEAWVNPLRVQLNSTPAALSADNLYNIWKNEGDPAKTDWVFEVNGSKYFNPAYPEVREKIIEGVREIVQNYDVDAIHFDDYFYPVSNESYDKTAYDQYVAKCADGAALSISEWRKSNVNALVSGCYSAIKSEKPNVSFGISPAANVSNNDKMGADVKTWGSVNGYVDYLCPQIYFNFENKVLPFTEAASLWRSIVTCNKVKLCFGLALYKAGSESADSGTWHNSNDILKSEVIKSREIGVNDFVLYSYEYLDSQQTEQEVQNVMSVLK